MPSESAVLCALSDTLWLAFERMKKEGMEEGNTQPDCISCLLPNSCVEILTPLSVGLGGGDLGRWLGCEDRILPREIRVLIKATPSPTHTRASSPLLPREDTEKTAVCHPENSSHQAPDPSGTLILDFKPPEV